MQLLREGCQVIIVGRWSRLFSVAVGFHKDNFTFFVQCIDGTGLPDALHSNVTAPPFLAVTCPLVGTARMLGGTAIKRKFIILESI